MTEKTLIIMKGIPGSGKSTLAQELAGDSGKIFSTDDYWGIPYKFDFKLLAEAHVWNRKRCQYAMELDEPLIIIDNTNIKKKDYRKYLDLAEKFGYTVKYAKSSTPWATNAEECFKRNTHNVPLEVIQNMLKNFEEEDEYIT